MQPVVRQFVYEEGLAAFALDAGAFKERLTHPFEIIRRRGGQLFRPMVDAAQLPGNMRDVRQFHRAFNQRMAGQDLFHQRGPCTWQAEDEDRVCRITTLPGALRKKLSREQPLCRLHMARDIALMAFQFGGAEAVAFIIMVEGHSSVLAVLQRFPERKMEMEAVFR